MSGSISKRRELPSPSYLRTILRYEDGKLFWLERPAKNFSSGHNANVWNGTHAGKRAGSAMLNGYRMVAIDGTKYLEHRLIHHMVNGPVRIADTVDHIDHDHTNNRAENLRACTHAQNAMNQPKRRAGRLPKHVYWSKQEKKYKVQMRALGRMHFIGTFASLDDASAAAADARQNLHGDYEFRGAAA